MYYSLIVKIISEIIKLLEINHNEELDTNNIKIVRVRCEKPTDYNICIYHILNNPSLSSKEHPTPDSVRIYYGYDDNASFILNHGIVINCSSYSQIINIFILHFQLF